MKYLMIESRSPWDSGDVGYYYSLAEDLADAGNEVTVFLVQNGVMPARKGATKNGLAALAGKVKVVADEFSLRERAIPSDGLIDGVSPAQIDIVVDLLADGVKTIWH